MGTPARYYSSTAVRSTLAASIGASDTALQVASDSGLPTSYPFTLVLEKDSANEEIVTVTARVGSEFTVTRGVDGTSGRTHSAGTSVEHALIALDLTDFRSHQAAGSNVHDIGAGASVVGTTTAQTLSNKTLTSPTIDTPTVSGGTITNATITNPTFTGDLKTPAPYGVEFEGTTDDAFETRLIASGPTADRTVTLPDATDTLVGKATTDTLTNKTISGGTLSGTTTNTGTISGGTVSGATITSGALSDALDANSQKVTNLGAPSASTDAATKGYVDSTTVASSGDTMSGALAMGSNKITDVGTPTAPTDAATKGYVDTAVSNVVDAAPGALDTLNELAAALGDDANFSTTVTNSIATKVAKAGDTMTGSLTFTGGAKVTGLPTPSASSDAAPKSYVDGRVADTGDTMTGNLTFSGGATVTGIPSPSASSDAVPLSYVTTLYGSTASAATSAAAAADSASAAASSQSSSSASATAAANSATAAAASATAAAGSASSASASATAADGSASAAAASKTATDAVYSAAELNFGDGRAPVFLMMGG